MISFTPEMCKACDALIAAFAGRPIYVYDIETYPNVFTLDILHVQSMQRVTYEISPRRNDFAVIIRNLDHMRNTGAIMVGYNNVGFDYTVLHFMLSRRNQHITVGDIYEKAMFVIKSDEYFDKVIWESERHYHL